MSYTNSIGRVYYLHCKTMKNGTNLHFFSRDPSNAVPLPDGYTVVEAKRSKLPLVKKAEVS